MDQTIIIAPSILSSDFGHLAEQLKEIETHGADWVHIDVMDGLFVPNITMGPFIVKHCNALSQLPLDVHLMIEKPENHIHSFIQAGAKKVSIHVEGNPNVYRTLQEIRELGASPGVVLSPGTPAYAVECLMDVIDMVLIMTVNPGFSGQKHIPAMSRKVEQVAKMIESSGRDIIIEVDGGITAETLPLMFSAGARAFVAATSIFKHTNGIKAGIRDLRSSIHDE
jgi:ribulose-phosphate 3-epimerase